MPVAISATISPAWSLSVPGKSLFTSSTAWGKRKSIRPAVTAIEASRRRPTPGQTNAAAATPITTRADRTRRTSWTFEISQ